MRKLMDKLVLFAACFLFPVFRPEGNLVVVSFLTAVAFTSLNSCLEEQKSWWTGIIYSLLCIWRKEFLIFLGPVVYDCAGKKEWYFRFSWVIGISAFMRWQDITAFLAVSIICGFGFLLEIRTSAYEKAVQVYFDMQDATREKALSLERKNMDLMEKQDYEVRLATLTERNRIAREIHDNVGHLLTRSLFQISALQVIHKEDEVLGGELEQVRKTLSEAMDSVRKSVHDLHEESVNLQIQIENLIEEFRFCPVKLIYQAGEVPKEIKYCFIAIVKEALSNIAKHSNATRAEITVTEHPAFFQLVVKDNGSSAGADADKMESAMTEGGGGQPDMENGIGLQNIRDRAEALGGVFRVEKKHGFRLFVSIPVQDHGQIKGERQKV